MNFYKKKFAILIIVITLFKGDSEAQKLDSINAYQTIISEFYSNLLQKKFVSIKDCDKLFRSICLEYEEYLFLHSCRSNKPNQECIKLARERFSNQTSYESLLFKEFKKQKKQLTTGQDYQSIKGAVDNIKFGNKGEIELKFSNGSLIFMFSNPEFEQLYLTDIFLVDGSSVFNRVVGTQEMHHYK